MPLSFFFLYVCAVYALSEKGLCNVKFCVSFTLQEREKKYKIKTENACFI